MGKQWKQWEIYFWGAPKSLQMLTAAISHQGDANKKGESGYRQIFFSWAPKSLLVVMVAMRLKEARSLEEELKSLLMKEESEKAGLKLNIQKTKIMASGPITSRQVDGETMELMADVIFLGSKITAW